MLPGIIEEVWNPRRCPECGALGIGDTDPRLEKIRRWAENSLPRISYPGQPEKDDAARKAVESCKEDIRRFLDGE